MANAKGAPSYIGAYQKAAAVTKSDVTVFGETTDALWVGGAGAVAVRMKTGDAVTFAAVPAGSLLPIEVDKVLETGTDATSIVRLNY